MCGGEELVLGSPRLISSPLRLVSWKSLLQAPPALGKKKVGFSQAFPELDFHRAQAAENRERGIISRKDGERERRGFRGRRKFAVLSHPPLRSLVGVFYSELTERSNYVGTVMTHAEADMKGLSRRIPDP